MSHRVVSNIRQNFLPVDPLLCIPGLHLGNFLSFDTLPRISANVIQPLHLKRQPQERGEWTSFALQKTFLCLFPLHLNLPPILPLKASFQPLVGALIHIQKESVVKLVPPKPCGMRRQHLFLQQCPVDVNRLPDMACLKASSLSTWRSPATVGRVLLLPGSIGCDEWLILVRVRRHLWPMQVMAQFAAAGIPTGVPSRLAASK